MGNDFSVLLKFDQRKFKEVERYLRDYPKKMGQQIADSMNRAVGSMNTQVRRGIAKRYNLQQKVISSHTTVHKANARNLSASVTVSDSKKKAWHLFDFKVSPRGIGSRKKSGVKVGILRGHMTKFPGAFVAKMKSGHIGVFWRTGAARRPPIKNSDKKMVSPITEGFSPTPAVMASQSVVAKEVEARGYEVFEKRMDHAMDFMAKIRQNR
ncbi:MAG: phage tail protein [Armatimonadota bacterium]